MAAARDIAVQHGWVHRSCLMSAAAAGADDDDIMLHAIEDAAATDTTWSPLATVAPAIALASAAWIARTDWAARGYVAAVDRRDLAQILPGVIAEWSHATRLATIDRLGATFGTAPVAALLSGLRNVLEVAIGTHDDPALLAAEAHRIAGLAGTLGFAALGRHWLRVAEGGSAPSAATRRATAHAFATLDRAGVATS
ncbi:hypothetical protein QP166_12110 [Sphingomonas sp. LR60]|uniref:hypothetical protein n=1 Tax=Sphingomonas sp. LR60 TaxID=3050233 RepID=UPI002FE2A6E9